MSLSPLSTKPRIETYLRKIYPSDDYKSKSFIH